MNYAIALGPHGCNQTDAKCSMVVTYSTHCKIKKKKKILLSYASKLQSDYEERRSGGPQSNFDHPGLTNMATVVELNLRPSAQQRNVTATKLPWQVHSGGQQSSILAMMQVHTDMHLN